MRKLASSHSLPPRRVLRDSDATGHAAARDPRGSRGKSGDDSGPSEDRAQTSLF